MTEQDGGNPQHFVATKNARRFGEMCDACRQARVVGLGYGPPGTGKTESAKQYAQWNLFKPYLPESLITFTGRSAMDGMYPYRPFTFASTPLAACRRERKSSHAYAIRYVSARIVEGRGDRTERGCRQNTVDESDRTSWKSPTAPALRPG